MSFWIIAALASIVLLLVVAGAAWLIIRRTDDETRSLVKRAAKLPIGRKFRLASRLARDRRIPAPVRLIPPAAVLYLAMPIDIIPDFIPVVGYLDDILVVLVAAGLLLKFVGRPVLEEHIARLEPAIEPIAT
jgi:uncharacterized membrane protein YkvA (DUF1232 family)